MTAKDECSISPGIMMIFDRLLLVVEVTIVSDGGEMSVQAINYAAAVNSTLT